MQNWQIFNWLWRVNINIRKVNIMEGEIRHHISKYKWSNLKNDLSRSLILKKYLILYKIMRNIVTLWTSYRNVWKKFFLLNTNIITTIRISLVLNNFTVWVENTVQKCQCFYNHTYVFNIHYIFNTRFLTKQH